MMNYDLGKEIETTQSEYKKWRGINNQQKLTLYELLAKNLKIIENADTQYNVTKIDNALNQAGIKVNKDTSVELKVIRLVMVEERQKASTYAIVLKKAREAGIKSDNFVVWLKKQGGIEKVRQGSVFCKQTDLDQKYAAGKKIALSRTSLATVKLVVPRVQKNDLVLLVARAGDNNQVEIIEIVGSGEVNDLVKKSVSALSNKQTSETQSIELNLGETAIASIVKNTAVSLTKGRQAHA